MKNIKHFEHFHGNLNDLGNPPKYKIDIETLTKLITELKEGIRDFDFGKYDNQILSELKYKIETLGIQFGENLNHKP